VYYEAPTVLISAGNPVRGGLIIPDDPSAKAVRDRFAENRKWGRRFRAIIADNLHDAGFKPAGSTWWGLSSALDLEGRMIWIVDGHGYGKRFIVRADEILTAFLEADPSG
jgi:hypothetical protein